jgi:Tfp pilus assembly protein PilX
MKIITILMLICVGIVLPIWFMQAADLQARIDSQQRDRALLARIGR